MDRRVLGLPARAASSSCRSTTARRPTFSRASAASSRRKLVLIGQDVPPLRRGDRRRAGLEAARARLAATRDAAGAARRRDRARRRRRDHLHVRRDRRAQGRRHHPPQRPGEHRAGRARGPEVPEVGQAVLSAAVPESAAAQPHVRPGDGDVHSADAAGHRRLHARLQPGGDRRRRSRRARISVLVSVPKILDVLREHVLRVAPRSRRRPGPASSTSRRRWWRYRRDPSRCSA